MGPKKVGDTGAHAPQAELRQPAGLSSARTDEQAPIMDKWKCGHCGEDIETVKGRRPTICPNPNCGKMRNFVPLTGPWRYFDVRGRSIVFVPKRLADEIRKDHYFATHRESWVIYHYDDGIYLPDGRAKIHELVRERLGELAKDHYIIEVERHIQDTTFKGAKEFRSAPELLCVKNGVLNTTTKDLKEHTPSIIFLSKLPAPYKPGANCPIIIKRLHEWTGGNTKDVVKLVQFAGFCLYRNYFIRKAIIIHGEGSNGKTTFVLFMTRWLGEDNVVSVEVQKLKQRFTAARLFGKLANLCDDLPGVEWFGTGPFKQATGGSPLAAEKKFKDEFQMFPYAKMLFTGNRMPIVNDDSLAFWDRIALIAFVQRFMGDKKINREELLNGMLSDDERSGLLNLALEGLASLLSTNEFFGMEDTEATKNKYIRISDPVMAFGHERAIDDPTANTVKRMIYAAYVDYCQEKGFPIKENNAFARSFKRVYPHIEDSEIVGEDERRHNSWRGVALNSEDVGITLKNFENRESNTDTGNVSTSQVTRDTHVNTLFKRVVETWHNTTKNGGEYSGKPTEPTEKPPIKPPKSEMISELEVKPEKIEEKEPAEPERIAPPAINPPEKPPKAEPTTQDIGRAIFEYRKTTLAKAKLAKLIGVPLDRLKPALEELEKKGAVRDMGSMVEVL